MSWSAASGITKYDVYEATNPSGPYNRVGTNVAATSYASTGLTNCTPYYYAVTSVDSGGFESAYSQMNTGCGTGGACVTATPLGPSAPSAPSGVTAVDRETGGAVQVSWNANAASDEVQTYTVFWGPAPGSYTSSINTDAMTSYIVTGLNNGQTYYFAVSATNCSHGQGQKSGAVPAVPHRIEGIKPPNEIDDLRIRRGGPPSSTVNDVRLDWTPPTTNVYGQPTTLDHQEVYAGTTPNFPADAAHKLATVSGTATFYIHPSAWSGTTPRYYLVVAVDTSQYRSGVSRELPRGIDALTITKTGTNGANLRLAWPAVTLDLDGRPTLITNYVLYGRSTPFRRSDLTPALIVNGNVTSTSLTIPAPAGSLFCYSVIAVDDKGAQAPW